jgi:hypothetical protein
VLEVGVEPSIEDGVRDGGEHGKGVHDEEQGQLQGRLDRRFFWLKCHKTVFFFFDNNKDAI